MQVQSTLSTSRTCQQCGRAYAKASGQRTGAGAKFCSNTCYGLSMRGKVERTCDSCGRTFPVKPYVIRNGGGKFCSKRCKGDAQNVRIERACESCGTIKAFRRDVVAQGMGLYCSRSCANRGRALPFAERFWALVGPADENGCRDWQGAHDKDGYGLVTLPGGKQQMAHRGAYELTYGPLGDLKCLHHCDRPPCCEPAHLFKGTNDDNMKDMVAKGRSRNGSQTHPERLARGEQHYRAKLTEGDVRTIRALARSGETVAKIAARYGMSGAAIFRAIARITWKHVE